MRILVLLGTDVHPFLRLREWSDRWAIDHPDDDVLVQHGATPAPRVARGVALMTPADLDAAIAASDIVVSHGGPGTLTTARRGGRLPVVIPRDPERDEHVDGHQVAFSRWVRARGLAVVVESTDDLSDEVESQRHALGAGGVMFADTTADTVDTFIALVDALLDERAASRARLRGSRALHARVT